MIPSNIKYPDFVPDQLLTSDNLNQLFGYLDEQGRMTRTNLLGIGIVCGFEVNTAADGTSISIRKGTGITSEGYLVAQDDATYTQHVNFNPEQEVYYGKFLTGANTKKFNLWELKQSAAVPGATPLTLSFLNGGGNSNDQKVVMLFVELLQELNKNCNPESCDDKGVTINVNLRPLLVRKQDADAFNLNAGLGDIYYNQAFATMPEMRIPRFDVVASGVMSSAGLFSAYKKILTPSFLQGVESVLTSSWTQFSPVVGSEYGNVNPFSSLAENFAFLNNGSIAAAQLRNIQYIYDHFGDLLAAYEEFRRTGMEVLSTCCPDSGLFPRHLLLDLAIDDDNQLHSSYRHYFRYSPLFQKQDLYGRLRSLFRRLVLMMREFEVPAVIGTGDNPDSHIRITPSLLDGSPISSKAIPYYYDPAAPAANPLFKHWSYEKTQDADQNLSYHAGGYSSKDFVVSPLKYDLEPYNFLRIEGHIGKPYAHVLSNLKNRIKENRLPLDVVALSTGTDASGTEITDPEVVKDIQTQYEVLRSEAICCLKRALSYWGHLEIKDFSKYGALNFANMFVGADVFAGLNIATTGLIGTRGLAAQPTVGVATTSRKATHLSSTLGTISAKSVANEYLKFQAQGDFNLSKIPAPSAAVLDTPSISHYVLIIIDEMEEIIQLLEAENPLALNIDALEAHRVTLEKNVAKLASLVEKELGARKPFMKIKAYVGEAQSARVDAISAAMPDLGDENVNTMVLLLLNLSDSEKASMTYQLQTQRGNRSAQQSILNVFFDRIDKDGLMIPPNKDVSVVDDPFLLEVRERLRAVNCLCTLEALRKLRTVMKTLIDDLKAINLFHKFSDKHPGLQHKAGVTMGGTFIVVYHRASGSNPDNPDVTYEQVSKQLADGTVVADFYLPYLSYSNAPPIVYQVTDAEPLPETVELQLQPNPTTGLLVFSVGDEKPYNFTHTPDNGTLTNATAFNGVTQPEADFYVFTPSMTKALLGKNPKIDLTFTYVKKGVVSNPVTVTVFNLPTAEIKLDPDKTEVPTGSTVSFLADTQFGDKFSWSMTDAAGVTTKIATTEELKNVPLPNEGTFRFSLTVTQSETGAVATSNEVQISVKKPEEVVTKTCGSLAEIVDGYRKLPIGSDERVFGQILKDVGIDAYFKQLGEVAVLDERAQVEFFAKPLPNGSPLAENLSGWLNLLGFMIVDDAQKRFRLLAMETYRLITALSLYVFCLKGEDLEKPEEQVFANMITHLKGGRDSRGILSLQDLSAAEKAKLTELRDELEAEVQRLKNNNETDAKPKFDSALRAVLGTF
jgi:hypothetical protein